MNIFYFGGTSFVSQYLIKDLSKKFNVVNFSRSNVKYCRSYYLNLSKKPNRSLIKKFNTIKPDYIFIFSSFVPLNEVNSSWEDCKQINIIGFINLIKAIQFKPKKIILASSCSLYGPDLGNKNVNSFLIPSSGYSLSKFAQENILRIFCNINNISFSCICSFNGYSIWSFSNNPTQKPAKSNLSRVYTNGISAVSPPNKIILD